MGLALATSTGAQRTCFGERCAKHALGVCLVTHKRGGRFRSPLPSPTAPSPLLKEVIASNSLSRRGRQA